MVFRSKNVDSWIAEHDPSIRQVCNFLRNMILEVDPELKETIKWGNPVFVKRGDVFYLSATDSYVQFGVFKGALVEGQMENVDDKGKGVRYVKVRALEDIDSEQFQSWIRDALVLDTK